MKSNASSVESIEFTIGHRLPLQNELIRAHYMVRRKMCLSLATEVAALIGPRRRPPVPWPKVDIRVERHSTKRPDRDGLRSCVKHLLDVLQPFHRTRIPYGIGVIQDDSDDCIRELDIVHVQSDQKITRVLITKVTETA